MLSDIESKLLANNYINISEIKEKSLKKQFPDNSYVKIIEKILDYEIFTTKIKFAFVAVVESGEIIDSIAVPLKPFFIRTELDRDALNEILDEFEQDFDEGCDA